MSTVQDEPSALRRFGHDLTVLANAGRLTPLEGCEPWVSRVLEILRRPPIQHYNPVLVGLSEAEAWSIVAEVVRRIARREVPAELRVRQVVALEWEALVHDLPPAGQSEVWTAPEYGWYTWHGQAAEAPQMERSRQRVARRARVERLCANPIHRRLEALFVDVRRSEGQVLLYVQQLQRLLGGKQKPYPVNMLDLLMPALARGQLRILGTCSLEAYCQYVEREASMQRRFQDVCSRDLSGYLGGHGV